MDKGIIDLIPAAVEAIKQETIRKMKLFSSTGKANADLKNNLNQDIDKIVEMVIKQVKENLNR